MALTPEGTPYVESTDLVANYPAASLSLANRVDLVGVLPFADSAARATAIPSPTDGQFTYLQDTNSPEFYNGSAYVPVGTAPGLVHISTSAFTTQTTVSFDNVFTSTYENYIILGTLLSSVANPVFNVRLRAGGSDNTNATYQKQQLNSSGTTVNGARSANQTAYAFSFVADSSSVFQLNVFSPQQTKKTGMLGQIDEQITSGVIAITSGGFSATTAFDGISFFPASGNITGNIRIYGYKNS